MNNNEVISNLLNEAAYLLDEAAARDERKEIIKDTKKITKEEEKVKLFLKGKLDKTEADKIYKEVKSDLEKLLKKANEIPAETTGEKIASYFRSEFTIKGYTRYLLASLALSVTSSGLSLIAVKLNSFAALMALNVASNAASIATTFAVFNSLRKTGNGNEKNWNKAHALDIVNRYINKIEKVYEKYYK